MPISYNCTDMRLKQSYPDNRITRLTNQPLGDEQIALHNKQHSATMAADYEQLDKQFARRGTKLYDALKIAMAFEIAIPTWGVGTGGTRFARFPVRANTRGIEDKLLTFKGLYRSSDHEDEIVAMLPHCTFAFNPRKIFGDTIGWLPWCRPGFELGLWIGEYAKAHPAAKGVVLESHGLFTWDDDAYQCYLTTLKVINRAIDFFARSRKIYFGGRLHTELSPAKRRKTACRLMPAIRSQTSNAA